MREKILKLAEGEVERVFPTPACDPVRIERVGIEGSDISGSFRIYTEDDSPLEGRIYSSNPYVCAEQEDISGREAVLSYTAHTGGFYPGQRLDGYFTIVTDGYDTRIPYSFTIREKYPAIADTTIKTPEDLYDLEKRDRSAAVSVFASEDFARLLIRHFPDAYLSYRAITGTYRYTPLALESFLCENGLKDQVRIHVFPSDLIYYAVNEDARESFRITRNTDGYVSLSFFVPEDSFVTLQKTEASDADFYGGTLEVPFFIDAARLHRGLNTTTLSIRGNGVFITKEISVSTYGKDEKVFVKSREKKRVICQGMKGYLDFRLRKTDTAEFLKSATEATEFFLSKDPSDIFCLLYKTMAQIVAGEKQQALLTVSMLREMITDKKSFEWAFLLYLCTLLDPAESYLEPITAEISAIEEETGDPRVSWFLLFLKEEYTREPLRRLTDIRKWIDGGDRSPVLYAEALDVMNAYPQYIGALDSFSVAILRFGLRYGISSKEALPYIKKCIDELQGYSPAVFFLAGKLYERYRDSDLLESLVSYLIRNRCIGSSFAVWYRRGIEEDRNIIGIYESYLYCLDESDTQMLPRLLLLYFSYENNDLSEEKREYLYASVIMYKTRQPDIYEAYKSQIEYFAIEKLQEGRIDDFLSVIYRDLYKRDFFDDELKQKLYELKDSVKISCLSQESGKLYIYTKQKARPFVTDLVKHSAIVSTGEDELFTVLINSNGIFSEKELFYTEKLLPELSGEGQAPQSGQITLTDDLEPSYADAMLEAHDMDKVEVVEIPEVLSLRNRPSAVVAYYLKRLIEEERIDQAFSLMRECLYFDVPKNVLLHIATKLCERGEEDAFLTALAVWLLESYLSNEVTLGYLCRYYSGPTEELLSVYKYAKARGCDVTALSGRILEQLLYEEGDCASAGEIFLSYRMVGPDMDLVRAVLTYFADRYVRGRLGMEDDEFFRQIKDLYAGSDGINQKLSTALLKYYSSKRSLSDSEYEVCESLLSDNVLDGRYFSFYKKLDIHLVREFGLYERVIIERRDVPGRQLSIRLFPDSDQIKVRDMDEVYDGIYITTLILFRGESIRYEICDAEGKEIESGTATNQDYPDGPKKSRFGLINQISEEEKDSDSSLAGSIDEYIRLDLSSDDLFSMV